MTLPYLQYLSLCSGFLILVIELPMSTPLFQNPIGDTASILLALWLIFHVIQYGKQVVAWINLGGSAKCVRTTSCVTSTVPFNTKLDSLISKIRITPFSWEVNVCLDCLLLHMMKWMSKGHWWRSYRTYRIHDTYLHHLHLKCLRWNWTMIPYSPV